MNKEKVVELAREAGFMAYGNHDVYAAHDDLQRFAALVAAHEREQCARIVDAEKIGFYDDDAMLRRLSKAIRARGGAA